MDLTSVRDLERGTIADHMVICFQEQLKGSTLYEGKEHSER